MKTTITLCIAVLITLLHLGGCAFLPEATYVTADGCGIAQWNKEWIAKNVESMTWTGPCKSGLAHGNGTHVVKFKNGKERRYVGEMEKGYISGNGTYKTEDGWKIEGSFLWSDLTRGKVYNANGRLLFDGLMAHNEKYKGKSITYSDQRYHQGNIYFADGGYIDDGRYDGSAGLYEGISSINPTTGKGIIYGKYIKNDQTVARYVEGQRYDNDSSYMDARLGYYDRLSSRINAEIAASQKLEKERQDRERLNNLALLNNVLSAAAGGKDSRERVELASQVISESTNGGGSAATGNGVSRSLTPDMIQRLEVPGEPSKYSCLKFDMVTNPAGGTTRGIEGRIFPSTIPLSAPAGSTHNSITVTNRNVLIVTNSCNEKVYVNIFSVADATMLDAGSDKKGPWARGDLGDYRFLFVGGYFEKGDWMVLAEEYDQRPEDMAYRHYHITPTHILVGAWDEHSQYAKNSGQQTQTKKAIERKWAAMKEEVNRLARRKIIFSGPTQNFNIHHSPKELKDRGFPSSSTVNFKRTWDNTH